MSGRKKSQFRVNFETDKGGGERSADGRISIGHCTEESVTEEKKIMFDFKIQLHRNIRGNWIYFKSIWATLAATLRNPG